MLEPNCQAGEYILVLHCTVLYCCIVIPHVTMRVTVMTFRGLISATLCLAGDGHGVSWSS